MTRAPGVYLSYSPIHSSTRELGPGHRPIDGKFVRRVHRALLHGLSGKTDAWYVMSAALFYECVISYKHESCEYDKIGVEVCPS